MHNFTHYIVLIFTTILHYFTHNLLKPHFTLHFYSFIRFLTPDSTMSLRETTPYASLMAIENLFEFAEMLKHKQS